MRIKKLSVVSLAALGLHAASAMASVETLPSGINIEHSEPGTGALTPKNVAHIYYDGHTPDGRMFSSWWTDKSEPAMLKVEFAQPCFAQALPHMQVGEQAVIHCPASTVLGANGLEQSNTAPEVVYQMRVVSVSDVPPK